MAKSAKFSISYELILFERPKSGESVLLIQVGFPPCDDEAEEAQEFTELALSAGGVIAAHEFVRRERPDPKYYIGSGKAEQMKELICDNEIQLVIFNQSLSPGQERNLEKLWQCRVLDRTGLILDIFASRARSFEGKLQVELAQLEHLSTRLIRGWTHLERQKGGIGLRGPGETQLELDRRMIRDRIKMIQKRLAKVQQQRQQSRRARQRALLPTVTCVGYTNAGKSTLFNSLTEAEVYAEDQLFATLDPTLRRLALPQGGDVILADTVGFIRHLPDNLVEAFKATLEETAASDLLIQVIDASDPERQDKMDAVDEVLETIQASHIKQIEVFNKIDLCEDRHPKAMMVHENLARVWLSAQSGEGIPLLLEMIAKLLYGDPIERTITLAAHEAKLRAQLYDIGAIESEVVTDDGAFELKIKMARKDYESIFENHTINTTNNVAD